MPGKKMLIALLFLGTCACTDSRADEVGGAGDITYVVCENGCVDKYVHFQKVEGIKLLLPRSIVRDADLSLDSKTLAVAVTSNPPLRLIETDSLTQTRSLDDRVLVPEADGNVMPVFCVWLDESSLLYQDERAKDPRILDLRTGLTRPATGLRVYLKDEAILSPDGQFVASLRFRDVYVYDTHQSTTVFSANLFPKGELWWPAAVNTNWGLAQLELCYKIILPVADDRPPAKVRIDWGTGKVERSDTDLPPAVSQLLASNKGRQFVIAYGYGRKRDKGTFPILYGPLKEALKVVNDSSFQEIPEDPQLAFVTPDGMRAAIVHWSERTEQEPPLSVIRFLDLKTGKIMSQITVEGKVTIVLFS
jgi:hypothetical protein